MREVAENDQLQSGNSLSLLLGKSFTEGEPGFSVDVPNRIAAYTDGAGLAETRRRQSEAGFV